MSDLPPTLKPAPTPRRGLFEETWPLAQHDDEPAPEESRNELNVLRSAAHRLLARARQMSTSTAANRQLAVIFAIAACDLHTEQCLTNVMRRRRGGLADIVGLLGNTFNLGNLRAQKIYAELTDDHPWGDDARQRPVAAWWADWNAGCMLRHEVAHAGRPVTEEEAARCIRCGVSYIAHVSGAVAKALNALP